MPWICAENIDNREVIAEKCLHSVKVFSANCIAPPASRLEQLTPADTG